MNGGRYLPVSVTCRLSVLSFPDNGGVFISGFVVRIFPSLVWIVFLFVEMFFFQPPVEGLLLQPLFLKLK